MGFNSIQVRLSEDTTVEYGKFKEYVSKLGNSKIKLKLLGLIIKDQRATEDMLIFANTELDKVVKMRRREEQQTLIRRFFLRKPI